MATGSLPNTGSTIEIIEPVADRNSGEQWMFEFTEIDYRGYATASTSNTVTCVALTHNYHNEIITIVKGRGFGQTRVISPASTANGVVTVTENWNVEPIFLYHLALQV